MSENSEFTSFNQRQQGIAQNNYSILGAQDDPLVTTLARLLGSKTGLSQGLFKDLILLIQALTGIENKGVVMAQTMRGAMQQYGAPGVMGNQTGFIGGNDVASTYAADAMRRQVLRSFTNPVTGLPNSAAYGLDAAEMGQAAALAMSTGFQYSSTAGAGGTRNQAFRVDKVKNLRNNTALSKELAGLDDNSMYTVINEGWADKMKDEVGKAAQVLGSIKEVLGSDALKNLGAVSEKLFGTTDINLYGFKQAKIRMAEIQAYGDMFYGGGTEGRKMAAVAFQTNAEFAGGGMLGAHAAAYVQRQAAAAGFAGSNNQGVVRGFGEGHYYAPVKTEKAATTIAQDIAKIRGEETTALAFEHMLQQEKENMTPEQIERANRARQQLIDAGGDQQKIIRARANMEGIIREHTGRGSQAWLFRHGGVANVEELLNEEARSNLGHTHQGIRDKRMDDRLKFFFHTDTDLHKLGLRINDKEDNTDIVAYAGANLTGANLDLMGRTLEKHGDVAKVIQDNPAIARAFEAAGIDPAAFIKAANSNPEAAAKVLIEGKTRSNQYAGLRTYAGSEFLLQRRGEELKAIRMNERLGGAQRGDLVTEALKGYFNQPELNDKQLMDSLLKITPEATTQLRMDPNNPYNISGDDTNVEALKGILGPNGLAALGYKGKKEWFENADNQVKLDQAIRERGVFSLMDDGTGRFATNAVVQKERERLNGEMRTRIYADTYREATGKELGKDAGWKEKENESAEDTDKRFKEQMQKLVDNGGADKLIEGAAGDKGKHAHLKALLDRGVLGEAQKKALNESVQKQLEKAQKDQADAATRFFTYERDHAGHTDGKEEQKLRDAHADASRKILRLSELNADINGGTAMNVSNMIVNGVVNFLGGITGLQPGINNI